MDEDRLMHIRHLLKRHEEAKLGSLLQLEIQRELVAAVPWLLDLTVEQALILERSRPQVAW